MPAMLWFKIGGAVLAAAMLFGVYSYFVNSIKQQQIMKDQNTALVQTMKDIEELKAKTKALDDAQAAILLEVASKNNTAEVKYQTINRYLESPEAKNSDRDSSEVLKETIRKLSNEK